MLLLALGSNLASNFGNRFLNIELAMHYLEGKKIKIIKKSSFYETPSYPDKKKPKFINLVILAKTNLSPKALASIIIEIEEKLERKRLKKNDSRTIDIDIIDYNNKVFDFKYNSSMFYIPHKKLSDRNFVLFPIQEIIPNWKHPKSKVNIKDLIYNLNSLQKKSILKIKKPWYSY